jgi:hypothetical protein
MSPEMPIRPDILQRGMAFLVPFLASWALAAQEVDPAVLLNWEMLSASTQTRFSTAAEDSRTLLDEFLDDEEVDDLFAADLIARLYLAGVTDAVPRVLIESSDRQRAEDRLLQSSRLLLLENRVESALDLIQAVHQYTRDDDLLLMIAELEYRMGRRAQARTSLSGYLRARESAGSERYFQALYLLCRILIDDGQLDAAADLLTARITADRFTREPGYYLLRSAWLLNELAGSSWARSTGFAAPVFLDEVLAGYPSPDRSGAFPDAAILAPGEFPEGLPQATAMAAVIAGADDDASGFGESAAGAASEGTPEASDGSPAIRTEGLIQLGSFSREANARALASRLESEQGLPAFVFSSGGSYRVLLDSSDPAFRSGENYANPRRLLLVLKEDGIEGFIVPDPR